MKESIHDELDLQLGGIKSIDSDIKQNTSGLGMTLSDIDYRIQYPAIIR